MNIYMIYVYANVNMCKYVCIQQKTQAAQAILEAHGWNVEAAINYYYVSLA